MQVLALLFLFQESGQIPKSLVDSVTAKAPRWVEMWSGVDGFRLDSFFSRNQKLTVFGCDTSTGPHDSLQAALFNFSSKDSTFAIDVFSGSYIAKMYNNRILAKKLPTTGIKIVDSRTDECYRTMHSSTGSSFDDVFWLDGRQAVVLGYSEVLGRYRPFVMLIDCAGKTVLFCESAVLLSRADKPAYYRTRFPDFYWSRSGL